MAILYRAIWTDPVDSEAAERLTRMKAHAWSWAHEGASPPLKEHGESTHPLRDGRNRNIATRCFTTRGGAEAFELSTEDSSLETTTIWSTTVRLLLDSEDLVILVENRMESDDPAESISIGRPRVVHDLLDESAKPRFGGSSVSGEPIDFPAEGVQILTDVLTSAEREMPVIVCTEPTGADLPNWRKTAERIARRAEGVALVVTLDRDAVSEFRERLGTLAVWGGGIRIYVPTPVTPHTAGSKHRYFSAHRLSTQQELVIDRAVEFVAELSSRRRVPAQFRDFADPALSGRLTDSESIATEDLDSERDDWRELLAHADGELAEAGAELDDIRSELDGAQEELANATGHLARLRNALREINREDLLFGTEHETGTSIPDTAQDIEEAVMAAQSYLTEWLHVPEDAVRDIQKLTSTPNASAWGNTSWRGLRALAGYARDRQEGWDSGGFWEWCSTGRPGTWPATVKKLSMTESDSVLNSSKLRKARMFPIAREVRDDGKIEMVAHLKVAEGGGNLAPRIYFHDDTAGPSRKMHVGFVGPHYLVPNKSTN